MDWLADFQSTLESYTLTTDKREAILADLDELLGVHKISIKLLEKITGKLLWVTCAWRQLRPLLNTFYHTIALPFPTSVSISHQEWGQLLKSLNEERTVTTSLNQPHFYCGCSINSALVTSILLQLYDMAFRSRRIWIGISDPNSLTL